MRTKSRYTRHYTQRRKPRRDFRWPIVLAMIGLGLYIALAMGAGAWAHDLLFGTKVPDAPSENEHSDSEAQKPVQAQEITETVAFPAMEFYALSLPAGEGRSAQQMAAECRLRGGAGYVRGDQVLLAAYESQEACQGIAQKLKAEQGMEAQVTPIMIQAVELRLTALPMRIDGVRDAFSAWQQTVQHMDALWQDIDGSIASTDQALSRMKEKRDALQAVSDQAFHDVEFSGRSEALDGLHGVIENTIRLMDTLLLNPPENILEVSAGIKYNVIGALTKYESYVEALTTEK